MEKDNFKLPQSLELFFENLKTVKSEVLQLGPASIAIQTQFTESLNLAIQNGFRPQVDIFDVCKDFSPLLLSDIMSCTISIDKIPTVATLRGSNPSDEFRQLFF